MKHSSRIRRALMEEIAESREAIAFARKVFADGAALFEKNVYEAQMQLLEKEKILEKLKLKYE